jgi:hypothetical protein
MASQRSHHTPENRRIETKERKQKRKEHKNKMRKILKGILHL